MKAAHDDDDDDDSLEEARTGNFLEEWVRSNLLRQLSIASQAPPRSSLSIFPSYHSLSKTMDALNGYASSGDEAEIEQQVSRSEPVAGPSTTRSKAKRAAADEEEEEEEEEDEDVQVDANDAFGLNSLNREEESADSTDKERRGKGNKKANGGTKRSAPESDANSLALTAPDVGLEVSSRVRRKCGPVVAENVAFTAPLSGVLPA